MVVKDRLGIVMDVVVVLGGRLVVVVVEGGEEREAVRERMVLLEKGLKRPRTLRLDAMIGISTEEG